MAQTDTEARIKVFISYSRADKAFASDLVLGLAACGFAPYIDRQDIAAGEDWEKRLAGLITEADTVVYVISPDSLGSKNCRDELNEALRLQKRILPVVWRPADDATAGVELKRLNYIFFTGDGRTFAAGLSDLAAALRTDIDWIREHTRQAELSRRWLARGRASDLLLRGDDIDAATAWLAAKPMGAEVTDTQADFIKASGDAHAEAERRAKQTRGRLLMAVSLVAVAMAGLAAFAGFQWLGATEARKTVDRANASLDEVNRRLNVPVGLIVAPEVAGLRLGDGWYRVAAKFAGAAAVLQRSGGGNSPTLSMGTLIEGVLIHPRFAGQFLFLAPNPFPAPDAPADAPGASGPPAIEVSFPTFDKKLKLAGAERIWKTPVQLGGVYPVDLWTLDGKPPLGVRAIGSGDIDCHPFAASDARRPVGFFTVDELQDSQSGSVTMVISELLDPTDPYSMPYVNLGMRTAGGAPVFDLTSGGILAMHIGSQPDPNVPGRLQGYGLSLPMVLSVIRRELADAQAQPGPLCEGL